MPVSEIWAFFFIDRCKELPLKLNVPQDIV